MGVPNLPTASHRTSRRRAYARGEGGVQARENALKAGPVFLSLNSAAQTIGRLVYATKPGTRRGLPGSACDVPTKDIQLTTFGVPEPGCATNITPRGAVPRTKGNTPPAPKEISGGVIRYLAAPHSSSPEGCGDLLLCAPPQRFLF